MPKIFIAHAWADDEGYNRQLLDFIKLLQIELEAKEIEVVFDDNTVDKGRLRQFMREQIKNCDIIISICDQIYLDKSNDKNTGVYYEIREISEHNHLGKLIPLKISQSDLPYDFGSVVYIDFKKEFRDQSFEKSTSFDELLIRIATILDREELFPQDKIIPSVLKEIDSLGEISKIINTSVTLSDIFTYPELRVDKGNSIEYISSKVFSKSKNYFDSSVIVGERQSGKSSFARKIFLDLYFEGFQPVYLEKEDIISSNIEKMINHKYVKTYLTQNRRKMSNIIVIVDDFHLLKPSYQEKIRILTGYKRLVLFVDDIFDISSRQEFLFNKFIIQPFKPSLREEFIEKIIDSKNDSEIISPNDRLKRIDESQSLINASLGFRRGYRNGIIPAFPLYLLVILSSISSASNRLDSPMSSYGHVYQLLIGMAFQNQGIQNDRIDSYINFLTYLSINLYRKNVLQLSPKEFEEFLKEYQNDYKIFEKDRYLKQLYETGLLKKSNSSQTSFTYEYLYYFFLGKYFSENFEENIDSIKNIVDNLDENKNGNICIFIAHHSKNRELINLLNDSLSNIFSSYSVATLDKEELGDFDDGLGELLNDIKVKIRDHREVRKQKLQKLDTMEEETLAEEEVGEYEVSRNYEVRRAIQTVEVIGVILKNRHGSIKKGEFETILRNTVNANLRLLKSFIEIVSDNKFIEFLEDFLAKGISDKIDTLEEEVLKKEVRYLLMTMNFSTIFTLISKTISSIGSEVISKYFYEMIKEDEILKTPSYLLIKRGLELQFEKSFEEKGILTEISKGNMSNIAISIMKLLVFNHASLHAYHPNEKARIEKKFGFRPNSILMREQHVKKLERD